MSVQPKPQTCVLPVHIAGLCAARVFWIWSVVGKIWGKTFQIVGYSLDGTNPVLEVGEPVERE